MTRIYIAIGLFIGVTALFVHQINRAYNNGYDARAAEQDAVNAETFQEIIKEYNNATDSPISDNAVDCILRRINGDGGSEDCGAL